MKRRSQKSIFLFWTPLAATWMMMALEGPFLAAVIARLPDEVFNLAAYGVTLAFAFIVESPVVMLMTASTALVRDRVSLRRLRAFAYALNGLVTAILLFVLVPSVFDLLARQVMALPDEVASLVYTSLWILLPWPAAIGYRRFTQGLLIRDGKTRLVAYGTAIRLVAMASTALVLFIWVEPAGAYVAAAALSAGVTAEAIASRWMARGTVARLAGTPPPPESERASLSTKALASFYLPLALTSMIGFAVHPMLTFFMGRAPSPVESLAVFPVVNALGFFFRSLGLAFQEVAIALMGDDFEHLPELRTFAFYLGAATTLGLAAVGLTPLATVWFVGVSGLPVSLANFALLPTLILIPIPLLSVFLSLFRGILVLGHVTRPITVATTLEVATIATTFPLLVSAYDMVGVTAAVIAFVVGRTVAVATLLPVSVRVLRKSRERERPPRS